VDGYQFFHGLQLHDNQASDKEVETIGTIEFSSLVRDGQIDLLLEGNASHL
jgi:hypothetical protein